MMKIYLQPRFVQKLSYLVYIFENQLIPINQSKVLKLIQWYRMINVMHS